MRAVRSPTRAPRKGLFAQANGGTLFLDEIGEMPLSMQVKLLRALQERKVRPLGGEHEVPFDARVVSATSRDLETDVAEQRFREDLYYRINVVRIHVPPLRARGNDVLLIAEHFVQRFAKHFKKQVSGLAEPAAESCSAMPGRATYVNCRTASNAPSRSRRATGFRCRTYRRRSAKPRPRTSCCRWRARWSC